MTGASAAVRHNRRRAFHHRLPIGIGHIGHQHVPWHHARHLRGIADDPRRAAADFLANCAAGGQYRRSGLESETLFDAASALAFYGFRPRLQNVQLAIASILGPFDIHWPVVCRSILTASLASAIASSSAMEYCARACGATSIVSTPPADAPENCILMSLEPSARRMIGIWPFASAGLNT